MSLKENEAKRAKAIERDLSLLVPIAKRKARRAGRDGICVEDVKKDAGHLLLERNDQKYLARLWSRVMIRAGLERVEGRYVRTTRRGNRGGNLVSVWRAA